MIFGRRRDAPSNILAAVDTKPLDSLRRGDLDVDGPPVARR